MTTVHTPILDVLEKLMNELKESTVVNSKLHGNLDNGTENLFLDVLYRDKVGNSKVLSIRHVNGKDDEQKAISVSGAWKD